MWLWFVSKIISSSGLTDRAGEIDDEQTNLAFKLFCELRFGIIDLVAYKAERGMLFETQWYCR